MNNTKKCFRSAVYLSLLGIILILPFFFGSQVVRADALDPSLPVTTCGELGFSGTYTLSQDIIDNSGSTCFQVTTDGVTINGAGFSVTSTASSSWAVDARVYVDPQNPSVLVGGADSYSNISLNNISFVHFEIH